MSTAATSHHGESVSSDWNGLRRPLVMASRKALVRPERLSCTQVVVVSAALATEEPTPPSPGNSAAHT